MKLFGDWKFFLTLVLTVAGVAIPVWLWQADLSSKSLSIKLTTRVQLQPKEQDSLPGMEISIDGSRLEKPHLVVFEIRNNGRKPIPAADFESPLDIRLESETSFARSGVTGKNPQDIEAVIMSERQRISLKPTLLNPNDTIVITAITSGSSPKFGYKARIIGISNVLFEDGTIKKTSKATLALLLVAYVMCFVAFSLMSNIATDKEIIILRKRAAVFVGLVAIFPGIISANLFLEGIGIQGFWNLVLFSSISMIPVSFIASMLNREQKIQEK